MLAFRYLDGALAPCPDYGPDARFAAPSPPPPITAPLWLTRRERRRIARAKGRHRAVPVPRWPSPSFTDLLPIIHLQGHRLTSPTGSVRLYLLAGDRVTAQHVADVERALRTEGLLA